jgi:hypothetical protein
LSDYLSISEIAPLIEEQVKSGGYFYLVPKGKSMLPTIDENTDTLVLESPDNLKKYDVILYKRKSGQFVLHRIVSIKDDSLTLCGDAQTELERGIKKSDVIAKVKEITRGDAHIDASSLSFKANAFMIRAYRNARALLSTARKIVKK